MSQCVCDSGVEVRSMNLVGPHAVYTGLTRYHSTAGVDVIVYHSQIISLLSARFFTRTRQRQRDVAVENICVRRSKSHLRLWERIRPTLLSPHKLVRDPWVVTSFRLWKLPYFCVQNIKNMPSWIEIFDHTYGHHPGASVVETKYMQLMTLNSYG